MNSQHLRSFDQDNLDMMSIFGTGPSQVMQRQQNFVPNNCG